MASTTTDNTWVVAPTVVNPDGNPTTPPEIAPVNVPTVTPPAAWVDTTTAPIQTPTTTEGSLGNETAALAAGGWLALSESASQIALNQELSNIDTTQLNTKIADAKSNQSEYQAINEAQIAQKTANELEYQQSLRDNQWEEIAALKLQQESENVANQAAAAEMKAKTDKAERDLQVANDISLQQSSIAFAKLGLSFSWAAINTAQKIFTDWMYNLSTLKAGNAKNYADLQVKINSVQFDHIQQISKIIQDTSEKEFTSKERLREFIWATQNNILLDKKEAQKAIQEAITTYKGERQTREDKLYTDLNSANKQLQESTAGITKTLTAAQTQAKSKIDMYINNWQWASLSPTQQTELEASAWIPAGTTAKTAMVRITQWINERLKELVGSAVAIPIAMAWLMNTDVQRYMKLGYPLTTAIQMTVDKYKDQIPEVKASLAASTAKTTLANAKTQAEIDKLNSEAKQNLSEIDIAKAKLSLARSAASKTWTDKTSAASFTDKDGKPLILDKNWVPHTINTDWSMGWVYGAKDWETVLSRSQPSEFDMGGEPATNSNTTPPPVTTEEDSSWWPF